MNRKKKMSSRGIVAVSAFVLVCAVFLGSLFKIQVIDGEEYAKAGTSISVKTVKVEGARGEILDRNGSALVSNRQGNSIIFDYAIFRRLRKTASATRLSRLWLSFSNSRVLNGTTTCPS